jgi:NAD dependent epimerase/dehydratase family enzyme
MGGLCDAVAEATGRPNWLPVPGFAVKALLGEGATVVLDGQKAGAYTRPFLSST